MPQRPGTLTVNCCHSPGLLPLGVARKVGLRTGAPPSTPTRGVPSGHLGGERSPILAHWLHHDGYGGGQPLVVHLRREEEVISSDDGHAESARSAEEGAQRVAAARLGAGGVARGGGTPACPRSSQPHTQAEPRTAGREFWRVSQGRAWRVTNRGDFANTSWFAIVATPLPTLQSTPPADRCQTVTAAHDHERPGRGRESDVYALGALRLECSHSPLTSREGRGAGPRVAN